MLRYALTRIALAMGTVLLTVLMLVIAIRLIPGDPAAAIMGPRATPELRAAIEARMGLDQPVLVQYIKFLGNTLRGDLGRDVRSEQSIAQMVIEKLPFTLTLIAASLAWSVLLGVVLGFVAALRRASWTDRVIGTLSIAAISAPPFVIALLLMLLFAVHLGVMPAIGAGEPGDPADQLRHLILPAIALGTGWVGYIARLLRASLLEVMTQNHFRTALAYAIPPQRLYGVYALRIAIVPVVTVLGVGIGAMVSGGVLVEIVFSRPGIGSLIYDSVVTRNYPVLIATVMMTTSLYALVMLLADLVTAILDPRVRTAS
jgi:peptide/nickel transport system permease protein